MSLSNHKRNQNHRHCGSLGKEQPESQTDETSSQADHSGGSSPYTLLEDNNFLMVEPFMDESEFLSSDNVF
jgi:ribosomal protein L3